MWLVTRDGFYSVVEQRGAEGTDVLVRARVKAHVRALLDVLENDAEVVDMPKADYRFRVVLSRVEWKRYLDFAADDIDYDSHFKEVVRDAQPKKMKEPMYRAMMSIWTAFAGLQPTRPYSGLPRKKN